MTIQELIKGLRFKAESEIRQSRNTLTMSRKTETYKKGLGEGINMATDILENWAKQENLI